MLYAVTKLNSVDVRSPKTGHEPLEDGRIYGPKHVGARF